MSVHIDPVRTQRPLYPPFPLTFSQLFGGAFRALRGNASVTFGFAVVVQVIVSVGMVVAMLSILVPLSERIQRVQDATAAEDVIAGTAIIFFLVAIGAGLISMGASVIVHLVVIVDVANSMRGLRPGLGPIWARAKGAILRVLGWTLLTGVALAVAMVLWIFLSIGLTMLNPVVGVVSGFITVPGLLVLFLWLGIKLAMVTPIIALERIGVFAALSRSWRLTRGFYWRSFGVIVLLYVIIAIVGSVAALPVSIAMSLGTTSFFPTGMPPEQMVSMMLISSIASQVPGLVVSAVGVIVQSAAVTLVYIDLRMRREGLALVLQQDLDQRFHGSDPMDDPYSPIVPVPVIASPTPGPGWVPGAPPPTAAWAPPAAPWPVPGSAVPPPTTPAAPSQWAVPGAGAEDIPPRPPLPGPHGQ